MDFINVFLNIASGASLILLLPGPTNTLLMTSGYTCGPARTLPLIATEALGYSIAISAWGFVLIALSARYPGIGTAMKLLCAAYLTFIAYRIASMKQLTSESQRSAVSSRSLLTATLLNPKALLFASMVFPREVYGTAELYSWALLSFILIVVPIGVAWAWLGQVVRTAPSHAMQRWVPKLIGLSLLSFSIYLTYSALK
ncbi:LysE family translocator [Pseudomonas sp. FEN]|uniref:LysE family translocator n=1 Tax=Pseudomonas sp. FEN TaxID=2767468 RepID=UPI00174D50B9|nr:LysE family transporter [Pseudomonas sp. FEN]CAD5202758.1 cmaU protein [Pseudomonas sp. FEN]